MRMAGRGYRIETYFAPSDEDFPQLAASPAVRNAAVLYGANGPAARALKAANPGVPLVFGPMRDPVGTGFAPPGGSITGINANPPAVYGECVQLLHDAFSVHHPITRVAVLYTA